MDDCVKNSLFSFIILGKMRSFPAHTTRANRGSRGITPVILDLGVDGNEWFPYHAMPCPCHAPIVPCPS